MTFAIDSAAVPGLAKMPDRDVVALVVDSWRGGGDLFNPETCALAAVEVSGRFVQLEPPPLTRAVLPALEPIFQMIVEECSRAGRVAIGASRSLPDCRAAAERVLLGDAFLDDFDWSPGEKLAFVATVRERAEHLGVRVP